MYTIAVGAFTCCFIGVRSAFFAALFKIQVAVLYLCCWWVRLLWRVSAVVGSLPTLPLELWFYHHPSDPIYLFLDSVYAYTIHAFFLPTPQILTFPLQLPWVSFPWRKEGGWGCSCLPYPSSSMNIQGHLAVFPTIVTAYLTGAT